MSRFMMLVSTGRRVALLAYSAIARRGRNDHWLLQILLSGGVDRKHLDDLRWFLSTSFLLHLDLAIRQLFLTILRIVCCGIHYHESSALRCEAPRRLDDKRLLLIDAQPLHILPLDVIFRYHNFLLIFVIWVYRSLPRMILQLKLVELLLGVSQ